jgi:hypothetical protein
MSDHGIGEVPELFLKELRQTNELLRTISRQLQGFEARELAREAGRQPPSADLTPSIPREHLQPGGVNLAGSLSPEQLQQAITKRAIVKPVTPKR